MRVSWNARALAKVARHPGEPCGCPVSVTQPNDGRVVAHEGSCGHGCRLGRATVSTPLHVHGCTAQRGHGQHAQRYAACTRANACFTACECLLQARKTARPAANVRMIGSRRGRGVVTPPRDQIAARSQKRKCPSDPGHVGSGSEGNCEFRASETCRYRTRDTAPSWTVSFTIWYC